MNITQQYINPVIYHPVSQKAYSIGKAVVVETASVLTVSVFLRVMANQLARGQSPRITREIWLMVFFAPIIEEVLFRGIIQQSIHLGQTAVNYVKVKFFKQSEYTEAQLKVQQVFRVRVTAFLFGIVHALNDHAHVAGAVFQCTWAYIYGLSFGYLAEKYSTLSVGILAHGINNGCAGVIMISEAKEELSLREGLAVLGILGGQVFWYLHTHDYTLQYFVKKVKMASQAIKSKFVRAQPAPA